VRGSAKEIRLQKEEKRKKGRSDVGNRGFCDSGGRQVNYAKLLAAARDIRRRKSSYLKKKRREMNQRAGEKCGDQKYPSQADASVGEIKKKTVRESRRKSKRLGPN